MEQGVAGFQLLRRKRPLSPSHEEAQTTSPGVVHVALPALAELLASQQQQQQRELQDASAQRLSPLRRCVDAQGGFVTPPTSSSAPVTASDDSEEDEEDKTPWPSAAQYLELFSGDEIPVYDLGVDPRGVPLHPEFIYSQPVSCMYFLRCGRLLGKGSFGFPRKVKTAATTVDKKTAAKGRKEPSKEFEWRKMSFVTGLPKKQPLVRYITATCYSRATSLAAKKKVFRMHAVMLADEAGAGERGDLVLVHIRAGGSKRVGLRAHLSPEPEQQQIHQVQQMQVQSPRYEPEVPMRRPVSPPLAAVSTYNGQAASTSPHNKKKRLHAEFAPVVGHFSVGLAPKDAASVRHSLFPSPAASDAKVTSARLQMRELILSSCSSRDDLAKYVLGLQEELAALQRQSN